MAGPSTAGVAGLFDVAGKSAVVTGGTRGIGLMIARGLAMAGARVPWGGSARATTSWARSCFSRRERARF